MEEIYALLKNKEINLKKLIKYGFKEKNNQYEYITTLINDEFDLFVSFSKSGNLDYKVIDIIAKEEYFLIKVPDANGEYVGNIREKCKEKIKQIIESCFETESFKSRQAQQVIKYVKEKYENNPEFLWKNDNGSAVFRHDKNKKWYGVLLTISKNKLGLNSDEIVEILDLKILPEEIEKVVDNEKYFLGYHMNKKHWFTIILDGSEKIEKIFEYIDKSYNM